MANTTKAIKSILFILDGYPSETSQACVFARNLITAIADMGIECIVIAPQIISKNFINKKKRATYLRSDYSSSGVEIKVYTPYYLHMSSRTTMLGYSMNNHFLAVQKTIQKHKIKPDAVYGHFIYQCGLTASRVGKWLQIPAYLGAGESDKLLPGNMRCRGAYSTGLKKYNWSQILSELTGVICVSEWTQRLLLEGKFLSSSMIDKMEIFPNGVNLKLFCAKDKEKVREKLGFSKKDFIVCYVGAFNENKGASRLSAAIEKLDGIKSIFIGRDGEQKPTCSGILYCGQCPNEKIAGYLQASDVFVLPTKSEGCCNAILEALACGLPVISSDRPFNDGILTNENSIRIDPENIDDLARAIYMIKENAELKEKLSKGARESGAHFGIEERAIKVYEFMQRMFENA